MNTDEHGWKQGGRELPQLGVGCGCDGADFGDLTWRATFYLCH